MCPVPLPEGPSAACPGQEADGQVSIWGSLPLWAMPSPWRAARFTWE